MALRLEDKKALVKEVNAVAGDSVTAVAAEYRGLSVGEMTELRKQARSAGVYLRVVKNTLARSNTYYGAWALNTNAVELPLAAATARVGSSQALYFAAKENIQTHGGMGYTWEFDCQFYYRRAKILALVIGSEGVWQEKLIQASDELDVA